MKRDPPTCNDLRAEPGLSFCIPKTPLRGSEGCHGDDGFHPASYLSQPRPPQPHLVYLDMPLQMGKAKEQRQFLLSQQVLGRRCVGAPPLLTSCRNLFKIFPARPRSVYIK